MHGRQVHRCKEEVQSPSAVGSPGRLAQRGRTRRPAGSQNHRPHPAPTLPQVRARPPCAPGRAHLSCPQRELHRRFEALLPRAPGPRRPRPLGGCPSLVLRGRGRPVAPQDRRSLLCGAVAAAVRSPRPSTGRDEPAGQMLQLFAVKCLGSSLERGAFASHCFLEGCSSPA